MEALGDFDAQFIYTAPYSPEFNPIEEVFGVLKNTHRWRFLNHAKITKFDERLTIEYDSGNDI